MHMQQPRDCGAIRGNGIPHGIILSAANEAMYLGTIQTQLPLVLPCELMTVRKEGRKQCICAKELGALQTCICRPSTKCCRSHQP